MTAPGIWGMYYDWSCTGNYTFASLYIIPDGTFSSGGSNTGHWAQHDGQIILSFDGPVNVVYSGCFIGNVIVGISAVFPSPSPPSPVASSGCWYALRNGTGEAAEAVQPGQLDVAGNKQEK